MQFIVVVRDHGVDKKSDEVTVNRTNAPMVPFQEDHAAAL